MDPNETLRNYRRARQAAGQAENSGDLAAEAGHSRAALEAADDLFEWLTGGGFLPNSWPGPGDDGKPRFPLTGLEG